MEYYVYVYYYENEPIYVGKGKKNRYLVHLKRCLNENVKKTPFYDKLNYILKKGEKPEIKIIFSGLTEDESLLKERELQILYGSKFDGTGTLFNFIECGVKNPVLFGDKNPMKGKSIFEVWVEKYGVEIAENKMKIYKEKMSQIISGRKLNESVKEKMSESKRKYWENLSDESKNEFRDKISKSHTNERRLKSSENLSKINKKRTGINSPKSKKCFIDGIIYNSIKEVCEKFNFKNHNTVINRIKSKNFPNWSYYS